MTTAKLERSRTHRRKGNTAYDHVYNQGLDEEDRILQFLFDRGEHTLSACDDIQSQLADIDCYLDDVPTSIKAEHAGARYQNIYFELFTQRSALRQFTEEELVWMAKIWEEAGLTYSISDGWLPGWYLTGEAEQYLILQNQWLSLYRKQDIKDYIEANGFSHAKGLSGYRLEQQGGKNTICGFIKWGSVKPIRTWMMEPNKLEFEVC